MAFFTASAYVLCWYVRVDSSRSHRDVLGFHPEFGQKKEEKEKNTNLINNIRPTRIKPS